MKAGEQYFLVVMLLFFIIVIKTQFWNFGLFRPWPPSFGYHKVTPLVLSLSKPKGNRDLFIVLYCSWPQEG